MPPRPPPPLPEKRAPPPLDCQSRQQLCIWNPLYAKMLATPLQMKSSRLQVVPGNREGAFNTMLLHLRLICITFAVGQLITFSVKLYYIYGRVSCYIWGWFLLLLWLVLHLELILITFTVGITFRVFITFTSDTCDQRAICFHLSEPNMPRTKPTLLRGDFG